MKKGRKVNNKSKGGRHGQKKKRYEKGRKNTQIKNDVF